ncbi:MAG: multiheme c-type cytochrome [bacterium]|nr:multiheme c-type cytochrome [bacterium]
MRLYKLSLFILFLFSLICFDTYYCQEIEIIYTNNTYGFLQPCSCPGAPFGGLNRRGTILKEIRPDAKSSILLDAGDLFSHINEAEKNQAVLDIYKKMNYDAVNIGANELIPGLEFLKEKAKNTPFISSNIISKQDKTNIFNSTLIIVKNDVRVGVLGIMAESNISPDENISNLNLEISGPIDVLKKDILALQGKVDFIIVLSRLASDENAKLAESVDGIDLIIGGLDFKPNEEALKIRKTLLVQAGVKGHYVGRITLSKKPDFRPVNKLYTMDKSVMDDPEIKKMVDEFENNLANKQLRRLQDNSKYLGSIYCKGCHEKEYNQWETTRHAKALESLRKEGKDRVLGCLSCHTSGYSLDEESGVQCEQCHRMLTGHDKIHREPIGVSRRICIRCHTLEQSPEFDYIEYLKKIMH